MIQQILQHFNQRVYLFLAICGHLPSRALTSLNCYIFHKAFVMNVRGSSIQLPRLKKCTQIHVQFTHNYLKLLFLESQFVELSCVVSHFLPESISKSSIFEINHTDHFFAYAVKHVKSLYIKSVYLSRIVVPY